MIKTLQFLILIELVIAGFIIVVERIDYTKFNAVENKEALEEYSKYAGDAKLYEAPFRVNIDIWLDSPRDLFKNYAAYYHYKEDFIKIDAGKYWTLPHELGHRFWHYNLTKNDRMKFCSNTAWENWGYDENCQEGFADLFGAAITIEKELGLNWKLEEGMFYIENRRTFSKSLENDERMEAVMEAYRA